MKQFVKNYSFSASGKTVTLTDYSSILLERLQLIVDTTTNTILYNFADSTIASATVATNVVTLSTVGSASSSDKLMIIYDSQTGDPTYDGGELGVSLFDPTNSVRARITANNELYEAGGVYQVSPPGTYSDGQRVPLLTDNYGQLKVVRVGTALTELTDGTNTANVVAGDSGYNGQAVNNATKVLTFSTSATGAQVMLANTDIRGYGWIEVVLTSAGGGLTWAGQFSPNSGGTYINPVTWQSSGTSSSTPSTLPTNTGVISGSPVQGAYFQLNVTAMTSGTTSGYVILHTLPRGYQSIGGVMNQGGTWTVGSNSAAVNVGQKTVNTTATQLSATSTVPTNGIIVKALSTNGASIFVGGSGVTTSTGYELVPGESVSFTCNLNTLYIISAASTTDKVCYNVE